MTFLNSYAHTVGGGQDPFFSSVVALYHFNNNGTNNGSGPAISSLSGTAAYSTTQKKFGTHSLSFGATIGTAFSGADAKYAFGTGDFTIEFFFYVPSVGTIGGVGQVLTDWRDGEPQPRPMMSVGGPTLGSGAVGYYNNGSFRITSSTGLISINTWTYIALSRASGTSKLWFGTSGTCTQAGSNFTDSINDTQNGFKIGSGFGGAFVQNGYIDEFRVTKGVGRYATAPTVPIAAFPNS